MLEPHFQRAEHLRPALTIAVARLQRAGCFAPPFLGDLDRGAAIVARPLNGAKAEIVFEPDGYPPMAPTAGNRALFTSLNAVNRDLGLPEMGELDPVKRGAADISFVAKDVDGLAGLGPASRGDHAAGETVDIASIFRQAKRAAILMSRLSRERR